MKVLHVLYELHIYMHICINSCFHILKPRKLYSSCSVTEKRHVMVLACVMVLSNAMMLPREYGVRLLVTLSLLSSRIAYMRGGGGCWFRFRFKENYLLGQQALHMSIRHKDGQP